MRLILPLRTVVVVAFVSYFVSYLNTSVFASTASQRWCSLTNDGFELYSYLPRHEIQELADALISLHQVADKLITGSTPKGLRLKIVAFNRNVDFVSEFRESHLVGFMQPSLMHHLLTFVVNRTSRDPYEVAFHEYTHFVMRSRLSEYVPLWYEEGFAQYLSTMRISRGKATLGRISARRMLRTIQDHKDSWTNVLNGKPVLDWASHDRESHYSFAWAVTHYLNRGSSKGGTPIVDMIPVILKAIGKGEKPSEVILNTTGLTEEEFLPALTDHFRNTRAHTFQMPIDTTEEVDQERACLDYIEVRELLADTIRKSNPRRAEHLLKQAIAREPERVLLHVLYSKTMAASKQLSSEAAEHAYELDSQNVDANIRMAELLTLECIMSYRSPCGNTDKAIGYYLAALEADHTRVDAAFGLGVVYLFVGRAGDALNYLRVAYHRAPWSPRINLYLGDSYRLIGNIPQAREHLTRATLWEADKFWLRKAEAALESL